MPPRDEMPTIGVLSPLVSGFYFGGILDGVAHAAADAGFTTVAFQCLPAGVNATDHHNQPDDQLRPGLAQLSGFVSIVHGASDATLRAIQAAGKPLVLVSHEAEGVTVPDRRARQHPRRTGGGPAPDRPRAHAHRVRRGG